MEELASERDSFELPPEIGDDERWQARLIMCPYATQPDDVHPTLVEAASEIDTNSTDDSQWLLFRTDDRVTTLNLSRQQVDFCAPSVPNNETYGPDASWESVEQDQTVSVTPVKHSPQQTASHRISGTLSTHLGTWHENDPQPWEYNPRSEVILQSCARGDLNPHVREDTGT